MPQVWLLALAQALCSSGAFLVVLLGGILGSQLAPIPALATLPVSAIVIGVASAILPAGRLMQRFGRRRVFAASALLAAASCATAGAAIAAHSFWAFCAAAYFLGVNNALVMQYRFAAVEYVGPELGSRAIATVMTGSLVAAWLGPELGVRAADLVSGAYYTGSFYAAAVLYMLAALLLRHIPDSAPAAPQGSEAARPMATIAEQPDFRLAVLAAVASYAVMSFIMTATPISMHVVDLHGEHDTKFVIQSHLLAMYAPSLVSGWIVARLGVRTVIRVGVLLMAGCIAVAVLGGHLVSHYWWAMVLLGAGWNLLFVSGSTLLTRTYRPHERYRVQTVNDFTVFGSQALASLLAGYALLTIGWEWMNLAGLPLLLAVLLALTAAARQVRPA